MPGLAEKDGLIRHPFDLEFGVRTSGLVAGRHLGSGHRNDRHVTAYYAVAPSVFQGMIVRWRRCRPLAPIDEYTFIDLGAGMGRAMLLAAAIPFVPCSALSCIPLWRASRVRILPFGEQPGARRVPMRMFCRDALEFPLPAGPCVVFLFNPFGAPVLRRLLRAWRLTLAERPAQLDILYVNNEQESVLRREPEFERLFHGPVRRSNPDAVADRTILKRQPGAEYAAPGWEDCSIYRWMGPDRANEHP